MVELSTCPGCKIPLTYWYVFDDQQRCSSNTRPGGFLDELEMAAAWASHLMVNMIRKMRRPCANPKISKEEFIRLPQGYKDMGTALDPQFEERELEAHPSSCSKIFGGRRYIDIRLNLAR